MRSLPRSSASLSPRTPPTVDWGTEKERRAFDYYRARSAPALSGGVADGFWPDLVVKLSSFQPAVRHSLLALSSLHESANTKDTEIKKSNWAFAFREYERAIGAVRSLGSGDGEESTAVVLLVCLLFVCIEFLADNETASQLHICQGRGILSELGAASFVSPSMEMIKEELVPIYIRLSLSSYTFGSRPAAIPYHLKATASSSAIPGNFVSLNEARRFLYQIIDEGLRFSIDGQSAIFATEVGTAEMQSLLSTQQRLLSQLTQWNNAFTILALRAASSTSSDGGSAPEWNLPLLYYHAAVTWVSTALQRLDTAYDDYTTSFASIISMASSIIHARSARQLPSDAFAFEAELIPPLYWTVTKCRHPLLRREALSLLSTEKVVERVENLWEASEAAAIAARVIEIEEGGTRAAVTHDGRLGHFSPKGMPDCPELHLPLSQPPLILPQDSGYEEYNQLVPDGPPGGLSTFNIANPTLRPWSEVPGPDRTRLGYAEAGVLEPTVTNQETWVPDPPYGVPEHCRVKNILIAPRRAGGVWLTAFFAPLDGSSEWVIKKEFLERPRP